MDLRDIIIEALFSEIFCSASDVMSHFSCMPDDWYTVDIDWLEGPFKLLNTSGYVRRTCWNLLPDAVCVSVSASFHHLMKSVWAGLKASSIHSNLKEPLEDPIVIPMERIGKHTCLLMKSLVDDEARAQAKANAKDERKMKRWREQSKEHDKEMAKKGKNTEGKNEAAEADIGTSKTSRT